MAKLRVLVGEDHESVRKILVELLRPEFEVTGEAEDGAKLVEAAVRLRPDVIVTDILMPLKDGFSARTELLVRGVKLPFVFVTLLDASMISPSPETLSYVHKADITGELASAVRVVADGGTYISRRFRDQWGSAS